MTEPDFSPFWYWINERHAIYLRKHYCQYGIDNRFSMQDDPLYRAAYDPLGPGAIPGDPSPDEARRGVFTHDPILRAYRFCNVFRELDRVTIWIDENIRKPYADHPYLWYMLVVARTINHPDTLKELMDRSIKDGSWPDFGFHPTLMTKVLDERKARGDQVYTGAYMIRAESNPKAEWYSWTKQRYIAEIVLGRLWQDREVWGKLFNGERGEVTLQRAWTELMNEPRYIGWGPFMSFQTVLEWRHTRLLENAPDATSWAAIGPGSMRGLNRLFGRDVGFKVPQKQALQEMRYLHAVTQEEDVLGIHVPPLEMEDIQNSLCEVDKWLRVKLSNGRERPRSRYVPGRGK